jgi:hypothetical protein
MNSWVATLWNVGSVRGSIGAALRFEPGMTGEA